MAEAERRLAAIVAMDLAGYSRLMGADEQGTLRRLTEHRTVLDPIGREHGGRIIKTTGDGVLAEFPSVIEAVGFALRCQAVMAERNTDIPDDEKMLFRIGINLGDVLVQDDDIFGDGVNVAARLEALAAPGGISVSDDVMRQLRGKLDADFLDGGDAQLKNIAQPVRVWHWSAETPATTHAALAVPDMPSIAVLPFDNMSGDPEQEYFADGITEDIITELSRYRGLMVIARHSTFAYKGKSVSIPQVGDELGVAYVLEGSIRKGGDRVRVTVQLIDAARGDHIWAERFDRNLEDIFAVQDEITQIVAGTLGPKLQAVGADRVLKEDPARLSAYDLVLRASAHFYRFTRADHEECWRLAQAAIKIDPSYARAYAVLAGNLLQQRNSGYLDDLEEPLNEGLAAAQKAVSLDEQDAHAHTTLSLLCLFAERHEQAISECRRAIELNPNSAEARAYLANALGLSDQVEEALAELDIAMRLNPHYPSNYLMILGRTLFVKGEYSAAIPPLERSISITREYTPSRTMLVACYWACGRESEAKSHAAKLLSEIPGLNLNYARNVTPIRDTEIRNRFIDCLRKAGLPE